MSTVLKVTKQESVNEWVCNEPLYDTHPTNQTAEVHLSDEIAIKLIKQSRHIQFNVNLVG